MIGLPMSPIDKRMESSRGWLSGLIVIVAVAVSFVGFARVSVGWTLAISSVVLIGLVLFLWSAGGGKQRR
jgi:hypothetical protein